MLSSWTLEPYLDTALPNGLRLLVKPLPGCPLATVALWFAAGTADEPAAHNGLAHLLEHMVYKGTPSRGVGLIDREVKALGGETNAGTCSDSTDYYLSVPAPHWDHALELLADFTTRPLLSATELEPERQVVLEEIGRSEDSPFSKLYTDFIATAFAGTPYARPVLGEAHTLATITHEHLVSFHQQYYRTDNAVLLVVGGVHPAAVAERAAVHFAALNRHDAPVVDTFPPAPHTGPHEVILHKPVHQGYGLLGYALPDLRYTPAAYALELATWVLAGGRSSRLFRELHDERGLVSDVDCAYSEMRQACLLHVETSYEPDDHREVMAVIHDQFARLAQEPVADDELHKAKRQLLADFVFNNDKSQSIANTLGHFALTTDLDELKRYFASIQQVTAQDLQQACARYLTPATRTTAFLSPEQA